MAVFDWTRNEFERTPRTCGGLKLKLPPGSIRKTPSSVMPAPGCRHVGLFCELGSFAMVARRSNSGGSRALTSFAHYGYAARDVGLLLLTVKRH